jgi:hypothetical protein
MEKTETTRGKESLTEEQTEQKLDELAKTPGHVFLPLGPWVLPTQDGKPGKTYNVFAAPEEDLSKTKEERAAEALKTFASLVEWQRARETLRVGPWCLPPRIEGVNRSTNVKTKPGDSPSRDTTRARRVQPKVFQLDQ